MTIGEVIEIHGEHDVFRARRRAAEVAEKLCFRRTNVYRLATAVSELANNLVFHARDGGTVHIHQVESRHGPGIEVVVVDSGPGIADLDAAMTDGFSTNGGLGGGLPGSRRLCDEFEISSRPGAGTRVVIRLWRS